MGDRYNYFDVENLIIIQNENLEGAILYVIPPRVDMASFPARVFAVID